MRTGILVFITAFQISSVIPLKDACNARSDQHCDQMSESPEQEKDKMGQLQCVGSGLELGTDKAPEFPQSLKDFGYQFNTEGQLRDIKTGEPFKFEVKEGDRAYNQRHYEALGEVITEYVYKLLEEEVNLKKHFVPVDAAEDEGKSFIFMSDNAMTSDKLMILIHGSGVVRAGQWARRLIINEDLDCGTMLPYIKRAAKEGYGVLITNGNEKYERRTKKKRWSIRGSENPERHFVYVWENFISNAAADKIVVVAHSYGGIVIVEGLQHCKGLLDRVKAVAFTDSVHSLPHQAGDNKKIIKWMRKNSRNWVSSDLPLDARVTSLFKNADCDLVSAGTMKHELTSHSAFDSVFKFFDERLSASDKPDSSEDEVMTPKYEPDDSDKNPTETAEDQDGTPENKEGTSQDSDKNTTETAEDQDGTPENKEDTSQDSDKNTTETAEDQDGIPENMEDTSQDSDKNTTETAEDQDGTPENKEDTSQDSDKNTTETAEDKDGMPENMEDTSQDLGKNTTETAEDQDGMPENKEVTSQDSDKNTTETVEDQDGMPENKEDTSQDQDDESETKTDTLMTEI